MLDSLVDRLGADLRQRHAAELAGLDVLVHHAKGFFHGDGLVAACTLELVDLLAPVQLPDAVVECAANALGGPVGSQCLEIRSSFDVEDEFGRVFGVFFEVPFEQDEAVVFGLAVEFAAVPEGACCQQY